MAIIGNDAPIFKDEPGCAPPFRPTAAAILDAHRVPEPRTRSVPDLDFLPVFLALRHRPCLIVGAGMVAQRKIALLMRAGADVHVVAMACNADIRDLAAAGRLRLSERAFRESDIDDQVLVIAATNDTTTNDLVSRAAHARRVLVNVVDQPTSSSAIMPSIVDRSPVVIAIGTGGNAPVLARMLRAKLESLIPPAYGDLAQLLGSLRERVRAAIPDGTGRRRFWETILEGPVAELFFAGRRQQAIAAIESALDASPGAAPAHGEVFLIGTGPGDPDLLTFRALRLMQNADVVVYDRLVGADIVDLCRRDAERIYVGKAKACHAVAQEDINELLVRRAQAGQRVARLKGGDPFMFGRGGEEIEQLAEAGIAFQVVPGITAALGCAAYAGIPLTHRDHAHSCLFITAHLRGGALDLEWDALVRDYQTLVVYMGVSALSALVDGLLAHGARSDLPAAIVERGTTPRQRVLCTTLADLPNRAALTRIESPATVIIGDVVRLRERLHWFEQEIEGPAAARIP